MYIYNRVLSLTKMNKLLGIDSSLSRNISNDIIGIDER